MSLNGSRSWGVAVICSVLNFLHLGTARLSGSMYLAVLERYHVDRSKASLPFILCYTVRNISGPLVGYLATKFGIYTVTMLGGLIAFVGIGCCYFAEDIIVVILFWGVVFGFGFGMGSVLVPEILNQHFDKYVSNANGIAFGGECIAGFVLPIFLKFSLNTYGLSGTFLILSSLMLNSIPATLLLKYFSHRQPSRAPQRAQDLDHLIGGDRLNCSINRSNSESFETEENDRSLETTTLLKKGESNSMSLGIKDGSMGSSSSRNSNEAKGHTLNEEKSNFNRKFIYLEDTKEYLCSDLKQRNISTNWKDIRSNSTEYQPRDVLTQSSNSQDTKTTVSKDTKSNSYSVQMRKCKHKKLLETSSSSDSRIDNQHVSIKYYGSLDQGIQYEEKNIRPDTVVTPYKKPSDTLSNQNIPVTLTNVPTSSLPASSQLIDEQTSSSSPFRIFLDPAFCMILLTQSTMLFNATMLWTVIVDFCRDAGLSSEEEIYVLIFLSVLDMIGRLGLGWITDAGYVSNSSFSGVCCLGMGISVGTLVLFRKVVTIGCAVSIFGLCLGGYLIVSPGMVNDHIHKDKRGMALASRFFLFAPMSLSQSPLIGYFRGKLGSYNFIFIIVAILCLFGSVTSILTPYAAKCRERRRMRNIRIFGRNFDAIVSTAGSVGQLTHDGFTKIEQPLELTEKINRSFLEVGY